MRAEFADSERELGDYFTSAVGISAQNINQEPGLGEAFRSNELHSAMLEVRLRKELLAYDGVEATLRKLTPEHREALRSVFEPRGEASILHTKMRRVEARKASLAASKIEGAETVVTPGSTASLLGLAIRTRAAEEGYRKYRASQAGHWETLYEVWTEADEEWRGVAALSGEKAAGPRPKAPAMTCDVPSLGGLMRFLEWEAGHAESSRLFAKIRVEATHALSLALAAYDVLRLTRIAVERAARGFERQERISGIYARVA